MSTGTSTLNYVDETTRIAPIIVTGGSNGGIRDLEDDFCDVGNSAADIESAQNRWYGTVRYEGADVDDPTSSADEEQPDKRRVTAAAAATSIAAVLLVVTLVSYSRQTEKKVLKADSEKCARVVGQAKIQFLHHFWFLLTDGAGDRSVASKLFDQHVKTRAISARQVEVDDSILKVGRYGECRKAYVQALPVRRRRLLTVDSQAGKQTRSIARLCNREHDEDVMKIYCTEGLLLVGMQHKNILSVDHVVFDSLPMMIISPFMLNGDLKTYLRNCRPTLKNRKESLGTHDLISIAADIVSACVYISERHVVHRALMTANVLVGKDSREVKLSGFGYVYIISSIFAFRSPVRSQS